MSEDKLNEILSPIRHLAFRCICESWECGKQKGIWGDTYEGKKLTTINGDFNKELMDILNLGESK